MMNLNQCFRVMVAGLNLYINTLSTEHISRSWEVTLARFGMALKRNNFDQRA